MIPNGLNLLVVQKNNLNALVRYCYTNLYNETNYSVKHDTKYGVTWL